MALIEVIPEPNFDLPQDVDADDVSYNETYPTVEDALDALLYVAPIINTFTNNVNTAERGSTVTSVTLNWTLNKTMTSLSLNNSIGSITPSLLTYVHATSFTTNRTYTLTAGDGTNTTTANTSISFLNKRYWGAGIDPGGHDSAFIKAITSGEFVESKSKTFTVTAGASEYIWFAYPKRLGTATFTVNGFSGGFEAAETISVTNNSGFTEDYYLYRSTNANLGSTTVVVT